MAQRIVATFKLDRAGDSIEIQTFCTDVMGVYTNLTNISGKQDGIEFDRTFMKVQCAFLANDDRGKNGTGRVRDAVTALRWKDRYIEI